MLSNIYHSYLSLVVYLSFYINIHLRIALQCRRVLMGPSSSLRSIDSTQQLLFSLISNSPQSFFLKHCILPQTPTLETLTWTLVNKAYKIVDHFFSFKGRSTQDFASSFPFPKALLCPYSVLQCYYNRLLIQNS